MSTLKNKGINILKKTIIKISALLIILILFPVQKALSQDYSLASDKNGNILQVKASNLSSSNTKWIRVDDSFFNTDLGDFKDGWVGFKGQSAIFLFVQEYGYTIDIKKEFSSIGDKLQEGFGCEGNSNIKSFTNNFGKNAYMVSLSCKNNNNNIKNYIGLNIKAPINVTYFMIPKNKYMVVFSIFSNDLIYKQSEKDVLKFINSFKIQGKDFVDITRDEYLKPYKERWAKKVKEFNDSVNKDNTKQFDDANKIDKNIKDSNVTQDINTSKTNEDTKKVLINETEDNNNLNFNKEQDKVVTKESYDEIVKVIAELRKEITSLKEEIKNLKINIEKIPSLPETKK